MIIQIAQYTQEFYYTVKVVVCHQVSIFITGGCIQLRPALGAIVAPDCDGATRKQNLWIPGTRRLRAARLRRTDAIRTRHAEVLRTAFYACGIRESGKNV